MKRFLCGSAFLAAAGLLCASETLIEIGRPDDFGSRPAIAADADGNLIPESGKTYISKKSFPVDGEKKYVVSFEYRNGENNAAPASAAVVAVPYDAGGRRIHGGYASYIRGSESGLVNAIKVGDSEAVISGNKAWSAAMKRKRSYAVAFNASKDLKDIPNFNLLNVKSQEVDADGNIVVKFTSKSKRAYAAGTMVRLHNHGWNGVGVVVKGGREWQKRSFPIQGFSDIAVGSKWWKGTKTARLAIYGDRNNGANEIQIRNLKLEEE